MRKLINRFVSLVIVISVIFSAAVSVSADQSQIEAFVERCYTVVLGRDSDAAGKAWWVNKLSSGSTTGISCAHSFFFCPEYVNLNKSDADYVRDLYRTFLNREPDEGGYNYYMGKLQSGSNDLSIFNSFATSNEFARICEGYGIAPGVAYPGQESCRPTSGVEDFIDRLYLVVHGRTADAAGKAWWVGKLNSGAATGISCAYYFFFSEEYKNKNKTDDEFLRDLYTAMFGRAADEAGLQYWKNAIYRGNDDQTLFNYFAQSNEFRGICDSYGIQMGTAIRGYGMARHRTPIQTFTIDIGNGRTRQVTGYFDLDAELEIWIQLNNYRRSLGLSTLDRPGDIRDCARLRAVEFSYRFENWHMRPNGTSWDTVIPRSRYGYIAENVAAGQPNATAVMDGWKNSATHNRSMVNPVYSHVGIAVFIETQGCNDYPDRYTQYYVQNFGG